MTTNMIIRSRQLGAVLAVAVLTAAGCGGSSGGGGTTTPTPANAAPVANAGTDQTVDELETVILDGSGSSDRDGSISTYAWTQVAGTSVTLDESDPQMPTFSAPDLDADETLSFELVVTDNDGAASAADIVDINIVANGSPPGGIVRTGVAVGAGPITGFGSIIVNGVTYDTATAAFTRDGTPSSQDDFKVGETVIIKGTIDNDNTNAVADTVELDEIIEGPVSSVNVFGSLTVLGQTVETSLDTSIDDSCPAALDNPSVAAIEVFGSFISDGVIAATRIACKTALEVDEYEVNGVVSNNNAGSFTFTINGLQVNYAGAVVDDNFPGGTQAISNGDPVEVKGSPANFDDSGVTATLNASEVEYKGAVLDGNAGDHFEIEGFISDFSSPTEFNVRVGSLVIPVTTTENTIYEGGSADDLGNILKVEVEGELNNSDVLQATKVEIESSTDIRLAGLVDAVSTANGTITILNITVNTSNTSTQFEDKSSAGIEPFGISEINVGDYIEARGKLLQAGEITAVLVERDDPDPVSELRGFIDPASVVTDSGASGYRESFVILGVTIDTGSVEVYRDVNNNELSADEFWAVIELESALAVAAGLDIGYLVEVKGTETGDAALKARELQLEVD